jgi:hypothetical protein
MESISKFNAMQWEMFSKSFTLLFVSTADVNLMKRSVTICQIFLTPTEDEEGRNHIIN